MSQIDDLLFETERRSILFHKGTSMPDSTQLAYDGDPNLADPVNTDGEFLLHYCPSGTRYLQKNVTPYQLWEKLSDAPGGIWNKAGASSSSGIGDSGVILPTNSALGGNRAVSTKDQFACYADCDDASISAVGISTGAVVSGVPVELQTSGKMTISAAGFTENNFVFVGSNGVLTQTPSGISFVQKVGIAHSPEILLIDISQPIFLGV